MSFWNMSSGDTANTGDTEFDAGGGNLAPIPDGSNVMALIDEAKWDTNYTNEEYISLRWSVTEPAEYKNRKIFQKLWVTDADPNAKNEDAADKKRDKALRMLAAIDANCGGKLSRKAGRPSDDDLTLALTNRLMVIKCMTWSIKTETGDVKEGNWIAAVAPKTKDISVAKAPTKAKAPAASDLEDDVPF